MIRVNLLPHREEKRKARRQQFFALGGLVVVLAGLIVFLVYGIISTYVSSQESKNEFLKKEIAALDKEIDEIKRLREQTDALLARKQIIESLQGTRAEAVHLFNELVRQVPDGIYLKGFKQAGARVTLVGYAQSNARVSKLMQNLDGSKVMEKSDLVEIKAVMVGNRRLNEFTLNVNIRRAPADDARKGAAKPPAKAS